MISLSSAGNRRPATSHSISDYYPVSKYRL